MSAGWNPGGGWVERLEMQCIDRQEWATTSGASGTRRQPVCVRRRKYPSSGRNLTETSWLGSGNLYVEVV